jgi:hypothetical protein
MTQERKNKYETLITGIILIAGSIFLFWYFNDFEQSGDSSRKMNAILVVLYNIGGKYLACSVLGGIGVITTIFGIKKLVK